MNNTCLEFRNLTLGYQGHAPFHHLSGGVQRGSLTTVVGANGSGKSTLLKGIAGILKPISGACVPGVETLLHIVTTNIGSGLLRLKGLFALTDEPAARWSLTPRSSGSIRFNASNIGPTMITAAAWFSSVRTCRPNRSVISSRCWLRARRETSVCGMSEAFVNPLARNGPSAINSARAIKFWARKLLALPDDAVVSVSELACHVPGCSPKETVILVMQGTETVQVSIQKALMDVTEDDVAHAFSTASNPH